MKQAVIIGAGPAGLTAAYCLQKQSKQADIHPVILEASPYIGGISRTATYNGNRMDLGGHRFFSKSPEVTALWREMMPTAGSPALDDLLLDRPGAVYENGGPDPQKEELVMLPRHRVSRIYYLRHFFDYPVSMRPATFANMGFCRTMKAGFGYLASVVHKRPENSLEDFYINRFGKPLYEMFFEDYTEKLWGVHPSKIAPDWGAQRVKGLSLTKTVLDALSRPFRKKDAKTETSLIESFLYPKKGPGQLWEEMANRITAAGGEIITTAEVTGIRTQNNRVTAVEYLHDGEKKTIACDWCLSTMPVKDLIAALGEKAPAPVQQVASALPYRDFITVGLLVNRLLLENKTKIKTLGNIVPDCWIYIQERDVRLGRLQIFNNWSPYLVKDPEHTVWLGLEYFCSEGDDLWQKPAEDFIAFATKELAKIGVINPGDVLDATHIRVKKAYPAYFGSYAQFDTVRSFTDSFENLYLMGRNGQHRYNNMDHSMLTAMEAVHEIITGSTDHTPLWNINTEAEYHEEKQTPAVGAQ